jgi:polar amino acid transport system substrate-binding protein
MKHFIARRSLLAMCGTGAAAFALTLHAGAAGAAGTPAASPPLTVGMHYVVPPFIGGAKVRTPEAIDTALAERLAERLKAALQAVSVRSVPADPSALKEGGQLVLASIPPGTAVPASFIEVPTGYRAAPMAIMRSDTDIKSWEQLSGRTVCVSEGGRHAGVIAARYGAIEKVFKAPADSLLALRTGGCDAAVHDDVMLNELLKLPEWKKFSAALTAEKEGGLSFLVPANEAVTVGAVKTMTQEWKAEGYLDTLQRERARDIAFEVYLDQTVSDCH